jgi:uncharacterized membrane protein
LPQPFWKTPLAPALFWPALLALLALGLILRAWELGRDCFWYDEVVTMRLATSATPADLITLLGRIDATRAPLHPLLLQLWLQVYGTTEIAARSFSVVAGMLTLLSIAALAAITCSRRVSLFATALAAISPALVDYSREARMYALYVLIVSLAWLALFSLKLVRTPARRAAILAAYSLALAAMTYTHPLGLVMFGTLALFAWLARRSLAISIPAGLLAHLLPFLALAPWLPRYFDHPPEFLTGRLGPQFLFGMPLPWTGGNFVYLAMLIALMFWGACALKHRGHGLPMLRLFDPEITTGLLFWLVVPAFTLYTASYLWHPIFGPTRYTLALAPAFFTLVARGLARMRWRVSLPLAVLLVAMSLPLLHHHLIETSHVSDWRAMANILANYSDRHVVFVYSDTPGHNVEVETARFYLEHLAEVHDGYHGLTAFQSLHARPPILRAFVPGAPDPDQSDDPAIQQDALGHLHLERGGYVLQTGGFFQGIDVQRYRPANQVGAKAIVR